MDHSSEKIAALIGSRICHDLISPIGAVSNGLELLELSGVVNTPEFSLVSQSAGYAAARIRFFRLAFGDTGSKSDAAPISAAEAAGIVGGVYSEGRTRVIWNAIETAPRSEVKMALLGLLCVETALTTGGTITVSKQDEVWTITASGKNVMLSRELEGSLKSQDSTCSLSPAAVQFALLPQITQSLGRKIEIESTGTTVTLRL